MGFKSWNDMKETENAYDWAKGASLQGYVLYDSNSDILEKVVETVRSVGVTGWEGRGMNKNSSEEWWAHVIPRFHGPTECTMYEWILT